MSSGVGPVSAAGNPPAVQAAVRRPQPDAVFRPGGPAAVPLRLPEVTAFKVSTINQRLASLAGERGGRIDLKA